MIYLPFSLWLMFFGKLPVLLAMISACRCMCCSSRS